MSEADQRRENRARVSWEAKVGAKGQRIQPAMLLNISLSGVYFETELKLQIQSRVLLESYIKHEGTMCRLLIECEVMRCVSTEQPEIHGYGTRFVKLGKQNLSILMSAMADAVVAQGGILNALPSSAMHSARSGRADP